MATPETNYQHILRANQKIDSIIEALTNLQVKMNMLIEIMSTANKIREEMEKNEK